MDNMVYSPKSSRDFRWSAASVEDAVVSFFEKTWFFWWMIANVIILRWFQLFSSGAGSDRDVISSDESASEEKRAASLAVPSRGMNRGPFAV